MYSTLGRDFPPFEVFVLANKITMCSFLMSFLRVHSFTLISYYLLLQLVFCKAYQNCLVALIKIMTVAVTSLYI